MWVVQPVPVPAEELVLAGGEAVLEQRLLPMALAELREPAQGLAGQTLAAGTQLVKLESGHGAVYCVPEVPKLKLIGNSFHPCLVDDDADQRFEGWFNVVSETKGLLSINGRRPKKLKAVSAAYAAADPAAMSLKCTVAIERRNYFNIYSRESFMIRFGCGDAFEHLTTPVSFPSAELPKDLTIMGAHITALSESEGKMRIRVNRAMPSQPFAVSKTTTVSFY